MRVVGEATEERLCNESGDDQWPSRGSGKGQFYRLRETNERTAEDLQEKGRDATSGQAKYYILGEANGRVREREK